MKNKSGRLELRLEDQVGVDYEERIYFPLYLNSYEDALRSIFLRVLWIEDGRQDSGEAPIFGNREYRNQFPYSFQERESNIISFIGARGSGKTTAMMEFSYILNNLNQKRKRKWWIEQVFTEQSLKERLMKRDFFFKVLEPIDASSLEEKEDLFEMIMSAMFREYKQEYEQTVEKMGIGDEDTYANREILALFDEIVTGYHAIKNSRDENFGDSYIPKLKYMSTSMDINKKLKKLIIKLLRVYQGDEGSGDSKSSFLVISLDDLDLNIRHGYEMLEQLRKYFFQANIIITLSGDYDQLNRICKYHYIKEFSGGESHVIEESVKEDSRKLALDYILKTLPVNARVFVPSLETMTRDVVVMAEEDAVGVKTFVMAQIAETMQIFYDIKGLKVHFSQPRTVRELVNYNQFLASLWDIDYKRWIPEDFTKDEQMAWMNHYDQNHERFNQDILGRLVNLLLDPEHRKLFDEWSKQNLERRASGVCSIFWGKIWQGNSRKKEYDVRTYAYGELLEGIYRYGRLYDGDKQFIKCVLAYLSSEMVREKISSLKNPSPDSRKHSRVRLRKFLGTSFGNSWLGSMVPDMYGNFKLPSSRRYYRGFGYYLKAEASLLQMRFPIVPQDALSGLTGKRARVISRTAMRRKLKGLERWLKEQSVIPVLECLAMFYEPMESLQGSLQFHMRVGIEESSVSGSCYVFARGNNISLCMDIFGFIKKTLDYKENYVKNCQELAASISDMLVEYAAGRRGSDRPDNENTEMDGDTERALREAVNEMVSELSIHSRYPWDNKEGAAFPFYDLDLSYNIMKRARNELLEGNPDSISRRECYFYIAKVYKKIIALLEEEKEEYEKRGVAFDYCDNFKNCPFVRAFLDEDEELPEDFKERLGTAIYNTLQPGILQRSDHPEGLE